MRSLVCVRGVFFVAGGGGGGGSTGRSIDCPSKAERATASTNHHHHQKQGLVAMLCMVLASHEGPGQEGTHTHTRRQGSQLDTSSGRMGEWMGGRGERRIPSGPGGRGRGPPPTPRQQGLYEKGSAHLEQALGGCRALVVVNEGSNRAGYMYMYGGEE